jgi:DUF2075 family protein/predicted GIY-YIG superfamily endonuclease
MNSTPSFQIEELAFNDRLPSSIRGSGFVSDLWPVVYVLSDETAREAYVGETADAVSRMSAHLKTGNKKKLSRVHLITSELFNKSATLDIEANLIRYMWADGKYDLINGNYGLAHHTYYQKHEIYWDVFRQIWDQLRKRGLAKQTISRIDNSDLFKYSPYKSLSAEQRDGIISILEALLENGSRTVMVRGGAGTGKSIMAVYLFKLLSSTFEDIDFRDFGDEESRLVELARNLKKKFPAPRMALVVPMSSFRESLKKVFKNIKGLSGRMVIGPAEVVREKFDLLVVDESHRLRQRVNLGTYFKAFDNACERIGVDPSKGNELDWILKQSKTSVLFYDEGQSVKPSDVDRSAFQRLSSKPSTVRVELESQFRVKGGTDYVRFCHDLMNGRLKDDGKRFSSLNYELLSFESLADMVSMVKAKEREFGLSRMVAGYSWKWVSREEGVSHDIEVEDVRLKWNSRTVDWINTPGSEDEVGCIHTTQGYDLNYTAIIFGHEISYDEERGRIVILPENYHDRNGKQGIADPEKLQEYIVNIYVTLMLRGIRGTFVYACDPALRRYFNRHVPRYSSYGENDLLTQAAE